MSAPGSRSSSDDELQQRLSRMAGEVDPVPPAVLAAGREAFGWRRIDAELAELLADSALEPSLPALARGGEASLRSVTFGVGRRTIDVEVGEAGPSGGPSGSGGPSEPGGRGEREPVRRLRGQLSPGAEATVEVQRADGTLAVTTRSDAFGRFVLDVPGSGTIRLRLSDVTDTAPIETAWFGV